MYNPEVAKRRQRARPKTRCLLNVLFHFRSEWFHYPSIIHWRSAFFPFQLERFHTRRIGFCHWIPIRSLSYLWRASTPSWVNEFHLQAYSIGLLCALLEVQLYNSFDSTYCTWSLSPLCMNRCHLYFTCPLHTMGRLGCQQDCTEPLPHWGNWAQRPAEVMHQSLQHTAGCLVRHWSKL